MDISKENFSTAREVMEKHAPSVLTIVGVVDMLNAAEINRKLQLREQLDDAYSYMDADYELYEEEVAWNRGIFYRVKQFFKRLFHK